MRFTLTIFLVILFLPQVYSQNRCETYEYSQVSTVTPMAKPFAIETKGWRCDSASGIEFDVGTLPDNNWDILPAYSHDNAYNHFRNDASLYNISNGVLELRLDTGTFNVADTIFDYTAAILTSDSVDFSYGYVEWRMQVAQKDTNICISLFGHDADNDFGSLDHEYREIDVLELYERFSTSANEKTWGDVYTKPSGDTDMVWHASFLESDTALIDAGEWFILGYEWMPRSYNFYLNHHYMGSMVSNPENDCVQVDSLADMQFWKLWIVNFVTKDINQPFPKSLKTDYIRFYKLCTDNASSAFYDDWAVYTDSAGTSGCGYGVWKTVRLGNNYDADIDDDGRHAVWATDGITLDKNFEVSLGTEFEARIYK